MRRSTRTSRASAGASTARSPSARAPSRETVRPGGCRARRRAVHLHPERDEGREVAEAERAQEERAGAEVRGLLDRTPHKSRVRQSPRAGGPRPPVRGLRAEPKPGPERARKRAPSPGALSSVARDRRRAPSTGRRAVRAGTRGRRPRRDLRKALRDLLRRRVVHARPRPRSPARDPLPAESAIAVENRQGPLGGIGDARPSATASKAIVEQATRARS